MSGITKKNIDQAIKFVYSDNNSLSVIFHDNDLLMGVVGEFNKNLQELEKITKCNLYSRGNSIMIKSDPDTNEKLKNAIQFLVNQFINNGNIENKDILSSVDKFMIKEKIKNNNVTDIIKTPKKSIIPRSEKQKNYVANAGYGVTCHDFKAMFSEPVDHVPRVVNGQASQRRISCVFVNPHTVSEVW